MSERALQSSHVGTSPERTEDAALLTGAARFIDDLAPVPGLAHAAIFRSPHAHARIVRVDAGKAPAAKGVVGVLLPADETRLGKPLGNVVCEAARYWPLAVDKARYFGEPVAVVVASSRAAAEDAAELIEVQWERLAPVVDAEAALVPGAPLLHEAAGSNLVHAKTFRYGEPEAHFARAHRIVSVRADYPRVTSTPIETAGCIAHHERAPDRCTIWSNFQGPFALQPVLADALQLPTHRVRLVSAPSSGGSFGVKQALYPNMALMALASRHLGVPVKWIEDRNEHLVASTAAGARLTEMDGAFDEYGVLLALRIRQLENLGAYIRAPEPAALYRMHNTASGPYKVRHIAIDNRAVVTNQMPTGLNRGFGGPQFVYPLERLIDKAARQLGLDTIEIRRRNLVERDAFPYDTPAGSVLDSGDYHAAIDELVRIADLGELIEQRAVARKAGRKLGIGIACSIETSASNMAYVNLAMTQEQRARSLPKSGAGAAAHLTMDATGQVTVRIDSTPAGQGHRTVAAQIVADELGVRPEDVDVVSALDTQSGPWSITSGNYANRFSTSVASAIALAARRGAVKLKAVAAPTLGVAPDQVILANGKASALGGRNEPIAIRRLAAQLHWSSADSPEGVDAISEVATFSPRFLGAGDEQDRLRSSLSYTFQADLAMVEIDPATTSVHVLRYASVHDVGNQLHPAIVNGQALGGFAHGLGAALFERLAYRSDGTPMAQTFQDYLVPTAPETPRPRLGHVASPSPFTLHGSKGLGDGCSMTAPAVLGNAVADALGVEDIVPPFTAARILAYQSETDPDWALSPPKTYGKRSRAWMMAGSGSTEIAAPVDLVWQAMLDPDRLTRAIPGCRKLERIGADQYKASIRLSVAGIGTTAEADIALVDPDPPRRVTLTGRASSDLGTGEGEASVVLTSTAEGGTRLAYEWGGDLSGKAAAIGHRMLAGVMARLVAQIFDRLGRDLTGNRVALSFWQRVLESALHLLGRRRAP